MNCPENNEIRELCDRLWSDEETTHSVYLSDQDPEKRNSDIAAEIIRQRGTELRDVNQVMKICYLPNDPDLSETRLGCLTEALQPYLKVAFNRMECPSLLFLELFGKGKANALKEIVPGVKVRCIRNQFYEYVYYLTPCEDGKLLYEHLMEGDAILWSNIPDKKWYALCTNQISTFAAGVRNTIELIRKEHHEWLRSFYDRSERRWEREKVRWMDYCYFVSGCEDTGCAWEKVYSYCSNTDGAGIVIRKLQKEIVSYIAQEKGTTVCSKLSRDEKTSCRRMVEAYAEVYMKWVNAQLTEPDVRIYDLTEEAWPGDQRQKQFILEEKACAFWLTPISDDKLLLEESDNRMIYQSSGDPWRKALFSRSNATRENCGVVADLLGTLEDLCGRLYFTHKDTYNFKKIYFSVLMSSRWREKLQSIIDDGIENNKFMPLNHEDVITSGENDNAFSKLLIGEIIRTLETNHPEYIIRKNEDGSCHVRHLMAERLISECCSEWILFIRDCMRKLSFRILRYDLLIGDAVNEGEERLTASPEKQLNSVEKWLAEKIRLHRPVLLLEASEGAAPSPAEEPLPGASDLQETEVPEGEALQTYRESSPDFRRKEITFDDWYRQDALRSYMTSGKVLLAGNSVNGRNLFFREACSHGGIAGVNCETASSVALSAAAEKYAREKVWDICIQPISDAVAVGIVLYLLRKNQEPSGATVRTAKELYRMIQMLRMNEIDPRKTENLSGVNQAISISQYALEYDRFLREHGLYDRARLLSEAADYLSEHQGKTVASLAEYALLNDYVPKNAEHRLMASLGKTIPVIDPRTGGSKARYPGFKAYSMTDEIRFIAEKILKEQSVPGEVALYYSSSAYEDIIRTVFDEYHIPVCIVGGMSAAEHKGMMLVLALLDWWKNNCIMPYFERILLNDIFCIDVPGIEEGEGRNAAFAVLRYFRRIGYLYGRENFAALAGHEVTKEENPYFSLTVRGAAIELVGDLVALFNQESFLLSDTFERITAFVQKYGLIDVEMMEIIESLKMQWAYDDTAYQFDEMYDVFTTAIKSVRINKTYSADAVAAFAFKKQKQLPIRPVNYLAGLSHDLLLEKNDESPFMTDQAIQQLLENDTLARWYMGKSKNELIFESVDYFVENLREEDSLILSYPYYDQVKLSVRTPASVFDKYTAGESIECYNSLDLKSDDFLFERVDAANRAEEKLITKPLLFYVDEQLFANEQTEPLQEQPDELTVNASGFNTLLNCPKKFALVNLFGLEEEPKEDDEVKTWFMPLMKSAFFNRVVELYIGSLMNNPGHLPEAEADLSSFDQERFREVCEKVKKEYEIYPVNISYYRDRELALYFEKIKRYLNHLSDQKDGFVPCAVGYRWNFERSKYRCTDRIDTLHLSYNSGLIDRVDRRVDENGVYHFRMVSYKTGEFERFRKNHTLLVQHYVCKKGLAADLLNRWGLSEDKFVIDGFEYVFPFDDAKEVFRYLPEEQMSCRYRKSADESEVSKVLVSRENLNVLPEVVESRLQDYLENPYFTSYDDDEVDREHPNDEVAYCPFKDICCKCE